MYRDQPSVINSNDISHYLLLCSVGFWKCNLDTFTLILSKNSTLRSSTIKITMSLFIMDHRLARFLNAYKISLHPLPLIRMHIHILLSLNSDPYPYWGLDSFHEVFKPNSNLTLGFFFVTHWVRLDSLILD